MHFQKTPQTASRSSISRSRADGMRLTMGGGRISLVPDARYSIASGAPSNFRPSAFPGSSSRRLVAVPRVIKIADTRNLRDKEVQYDMIRKIVSFLEDCVNPSPSFKFDGRDFLRIPSRSDFKNVFEFVFQCVQPNYQLQTNPAPKFNDEVVKLLNGLGYPYHLKNSTMQTMTSPGTWGTMLSVMEWLVNFIELEATIHDDRRVGDQEKWQLYVSCYKKALEVKSSAQSAKLEGNLFNSDFEAYRNSKLGLDGDVSFTDLRNKRMEFDAEMARIRILVAQEEEKLLDFKKNIAGTADDIETMEKYTEDLMSTFARNNELMLECDAKLASIVKKNEDLEEKRLAKEQEIANQKMSVDEARQLFSRRKMMHEDITTINNNHLLEERKRDVLQPKFFKNSSQIHSDYKSFVGRLIYVCNAFCHPDELQQQIQKIEEYSFLQNISDFKKSSVENKLAQLIEKLKENAEAEMVKYQKFVEEANKKRAVLFNEIDELKSNLSMCLEGRKLENDRFKRELDDEFRPTRSAKHNLDIAKQKHQATSSELDKYNTLLNLIGEELADKHKKFLQYKQSLDEIYEEFQPVIMDNMTKLCNRFERQHKQKIRLSELADVILKENMEMIENLDFEEKKSKK